MGGELRAVGAASVYTARAARRAAAPGWNRVRAAILRAW